MKKSLILLCSLLAGIAFAQEPSAEPEAVPAEDSLPAPAEQMVLPMPKATNSGEVNLSREGLRMIGDELANRKRLVDLQRQLKIVGLQADIKSKQNEMAQIGKPAASSKGDIDIPPLSQIVSRSGRMEPIPSVKIPTVPEPPAVPPTTVAFELPRVLGVVGASAELQIGSIRYHAKEGETAGTFRVVSVDPKRVVVEDLSSRGGRYTLANGI